MKNLYIYDGKIYRNRIPLLGKRDVRLWFYDDQFSKANWEIEPEESLDELYKQRAQFLRDKYDYLILCYSGGADSTQVYRSFIDNNIHLDEIHTFYPVRMVKAIENTALPNGYNLTLLKEYVEAVLPRFSRLSIHHNKTKLKVWDITDYILSNHLSDNFLEDNKNVFGISHKFYGIKNAFQMLEIRDYINKIPGKVAVIYGGDKPNIIRKDGIFYFYFTERGLSAPASYDEEELNYTPLLFYWDPDAVKIIIKQCHLYKKLIESGKVSYPIDRESHIMKKLLYPSTYESNIYQQPYNLKYKDDEILLYFFGKKEEDTINELERMKVRTYSKQYKIG